MPEPIPELSGAAPRALLDRPLAVAAALALLHLVLAALAFDPTPHVGGDGGAYVALARALLGGHGYVDLWDPARPPHVQFPPVFPALVALAIRLGFGGWVGLKTLVLAFSCAAVAASWLWLRRITTPLVALGVGAALAVAPGIVDLSHWELSDVPFWCFTALALWGFARFAAAEAGAATAGEEAEKHDAAHPLRWLVLASAFTALADLTRSAGLPLLLAAGIWLFVRHGWRHAATYAAVAGPGITAWWLRGRAHGGGYTGWLWYRDPYDPAAGTASAIDMVHRLGANLGRYTVEHVPVLLLGHELGPLLMAIVGIAVVALALAGWARRLTRAGLPELWLPLYAGVLLLWPLAWSGERLVLPLLPLLLAYAAEALRDGLAAAGVDVRGRGLRQALAGAAVLAMLPGIDGEVRTGATCRAGAAAGDPYGCLDPAFADFMRLASALRGRLSAGSVVISRKPTLFYAASGYPSRVYPLSANPDSLFRAAAAMGAHYVVVDRIPDLAPRYLLPILLARRDEFCIVPEPYFKAAALARIEHQATPLPPAMPATAFRTCPRAAPPR